MNFPNDKNTYGLDKQFMWGDGLLVLPVLEEDAEQVRGYFPEGTWYDFYNRHEIIEGSKFVTIPAPLDIIPLFVRGGTILPTQRNSTTTYATSRNPFLLRVYLSTNCRREDNVATPYRERKCLQIATGELFYDDGDSVDTVDVGKYTKLKFKAEHDSLAGKGRLWSEVIQDGYPLPDLVFISFHGIDSDVGNFMVNGKNVEFRHDVDINLYRVPYLSVDLSKPFEVEWTAKAGSINRQDENTSAHNV